VQGGSGTFAAHVEGPPESMAGRARARLSGLRVQARGLLVQGDAQVDAAVSALDPFRGADLTGTRVRIDEARVAGEQIAPAWWGRAVLSRARWRFDGRFFEAELAAHCRDARPIVGLYAHLADLPGVVKGLFAMDGLSLHGTAAAGRGWYALRDLVARGDGASVEAALRSDAGRQRGAALLTVHGISVALDLDGGSSLHLFGPGDFFAQRKAELDALPRAPMGRRGQAPRR